MTGGSSCCTLWLSLAILGNTLLPTLSFIAPASVGVSLRNGAAIADVAPFKSIAREPWVPGGATARRARQLGGLKSSVNADGSGPVTLLRVEFAESNAEELRAWVRRFPFAAILPVQPMSTIPSDAGVDVMFRKKPTREREGKDGGLVISIHQSPHGGTEMRVLRNTDGQSVSKSFSEKQIVARLVSDAKSLESPVGRAIAVESAFPSL